MELTFKNYIESYAEMGFHLGSSNVFDAISALNSDDIFHDVIEYGNKSLNLITKLDKIVGIKKMFLMLGPTANVLINTGSALSKIAKHPKKLSNWMTLKDELIELTKLAAMNPLIAAPIAIGTSTLLGMGEKQEAIILLTKLASSIYFYLYAVVKMMENSKFDQARKIALVVKDKVEKLMPKSELPH
jgi:hypothetical protein